MTLIPVLAFYAWVIALLTIGTLAGWLFRRTLPTTAPRWLDLTAGAAGSMLSAYLRMYFQGPLTLAGVWLDGAVGACCLLLVLRVFRPPVQANPIVVWFLQGVLAMIVVAGVVVLVAFPVALRLSVPPPIQGSPIVAELSYLAVTSGAALLFWRVRRWPRNPVIARDA